MLTVDDYIDRAKTAQNLDSDRKLSTRLGLAGPTVNQWRTRRAWPSDAVMIRLAGMAGLDVEQALMDLNMWRAASPEVSALYTRISEKLARLGIVVIFLLLATPDTNAAGTNQHQAFQKYTLCDLWMG